MTPRLAYHDPSAPVETITSPQRQTQKNGGDKEDRTPDLLNAIQALSQLSYAPTRLGYYSAAKIICQYP